ncbi:MAG: NAD(P)-dependent oxidoreductase [Alphaproteobacteria bacterium]|nr:NAD(P)-dependent oxidoreductase [Alphaproteobacteria bacterium]
MAAFDNQQGGDRQANAEDIEANFAELHPPLSAHEASVEADRCYFCHDAPCVTACPTGIDIPLFIRQIHAGNPLGAARTIFDENILGGMCARVCPTETLCEQACVREACEEQPVRIGLLQRFATDRRMETTTHPYERVPLTGRHVAVVGAGPAGLACAHRLALHGHDVTIYDAGDKPGGLNEYGIAAYKTVDDFAAREVDFILSIGGIKIESGRGIGPDLSLSALQADHDAVFISAGLGDVNAQAIEGDSLPGMRDAVAFIAELRQTDDRASLDPGRRVVVIGGGMTAIDAAVQSKLLGAEDVTIVYRRGQDRMNASPLEQQLAQTRGVLIKHHMMPTRLIAGQDGNVGGIEVEYTSQVDGRLVGTGEVVTLPADRVYWAIGQTLADNATGDLSASIEMQDGRIKVDVERRTSVPGLWAGGDCVAGGEDLTVTAVEDGKRAAESIHRALAG